MNFCNDITYMYPRYCSIWLKCYVHSIIFERAIHKLYETGNVADEFGIWIRAD